MLCVELSFNRGLINFFYYYFTTTATFHTNFTKLAREIPLCVYVVNRGELKISILILYIIGHTLALNCKIFPFTIESYDDTKKSRSSTNFSLLCT